MEIIIKEINQIDNETMNLLLLSDPSIEIINSYIDRSYKYVAKYNNEAIGIVLLINTRPQTMEIINVAVKEEYQGKGIGKKLVLHAIEMAKELKAKVLEIGTGNPGMMQMALYQKCGFRIIGVELDFFTKNHDEEIYENGIQCRDMIRMRMYL